MEKNNDDLLKDVKEYLLPIPSDPPFIVKGEGLKVEDTDGKKYLDFMAGPGVLNLGHCHPEIVEVIQQQSAVLSQCPGNLLNVQSIELAAKLARIAPGDLKLSFFCNSGAEAVDTSVKLAIKYASKKGKSTVSVVALEHSFHGRASLPLSLTGMPGRKKGLGGYAAFPARHIMAPYCYRCPLTYPSCDLYCAQCLENLFKTQAPAESIAAFICEPIMGVGGVIIPPPEYLPQIREICSRNEVLLILDEVFAGFGRTGKMFAGEHFDVAPDIMAVAKALGGGFPLGAAICTQEVAAAFEAGDHYTTYGWNNVIGLAAGIKTLEIMERENIADHAAEIGTYFLSELKMLQDRHAFIGDVRGKGLFIGVEIVEDRSSKIPDAKRAKKIKADLKAKGLLVGITGNHACVVRITPPLIITKEHVDDFVDKFKETLDML